MVSPVADDGGGLLSVGSGAGAADVEEEEDIVDFGISVEERELVAKVVVICAKEEAGRISERKRSVEENGSVLEHPQDGLECCLEGMLICTRKEPMLKEGKKRDQGD